VRAGMNDGMMRSVRVPASSANLGPGFDTLGLALDIYLECRFAASDALRIEVSGRDAASISTDSTNLIWQTMAAYGAPPLHLQIHNEIPLGKGLGSSAAAITAGVVIANEVAGLKWSRGRILDETAKLEGHPDNVAASTLGGVTASAFGEDGKAHAVRLELPAGICIAVVTPDFVLRTSTARAALPDCYPKADAIFNLQRTALMVAALAKSSIREFAASLGDRLHQPYRASLVPGLAEILALKEPGLLGCVLSGAGPSVLVFYEEGAEACCELVKSVFAAHGQSAEIMKTKVAPEGFRLLSKV
jgi:homoserine kinase